MDNIQEQFRANNGDEFVLSPGEYQGPLRIDRPCVVDGSRATLWQTSGPVLEIAADNVTVKNLRVELAGDDAAPAGDARAAAVQVTAAGAAHIKLENVEVKGAVIGLPQEAENWALPSMISLGEFAADTENTFTLELEAAAPARLECKMRDVRFSPQTLQAGKNIINLTTSEMRNNTILYGDIMVQTAVGRRIYITGKAVAGAPVHNQGQPVPNGPGVSLPVQMPAPTEMLAPNVDDSNVQYIKRGQRLSIKEWQNDVLKIALEYQTEDAQLEIDGYSFLLKAGGKVRKDEDLIFFGNMESEGGAVKMSQVNDRPLALVDLAKMPADVERLAVCYSIYGDDQRQRFAAVQGAVVRIFTPDKEIFRFALDELREEKTAVAVEVYLYKGEWKMNFVGAGYRSGLKHLCESYGVDIE